MNILTSFLFKKEIHNLTCVLQLHQLNFTKNSKQFLKQILAQKNP